MSDKKLVALQIKDARKAGYAAAWDVIEDVPLKDLGSDRGGEEWVPVSAMWRVLYAYQAATERALLGDDAPEPDLMSKSV